MGDTQADAIQNASEGGVAGTYPDAVSFQFLVAPSTSNEFNTARLRLIPVACWRVDDIRFAFDSSFVTFDSSPNPKDIRTELQDLARLVRAHPGSPLSIFGHADPVGNDDYNKALSGRRAIAIYAILISNTNSGKAVRLWQGISAQENWDADKRQAMQTLTGLSDGTPDSNLFKAYMQALCPADLQLTPQDFLAQGADLGGKGDYQGCSEFNPKLIFSQQKETQFEQDEDKSTRNAANAPNRRVLVLLFRKGSKVDPTKWPCPRANEGIGGCVKRFFSDGERRRSTRLPDKDRKFEGTNDTFACRFYQRMSSSSPCERFLETIRIRLFDRLAQPIPGAPYVIVVEGLERPLSTADANGDITLHHVKVPSTCTVRWSRPDELRNAPRGPAPDIDEFRASLLADGLTDEDIQRLQGPPPTETGFEFERDLFINVDERTNDTEAQSADGVDTADQRRLHNLGYSTELTQEENLLAFQRDCEAAAPGPLSDVKAELKKRHDECNPPPRFEIT